MLKEQLLEEAQNIDASVALDSIFESVELSDEVKENFSTVFEAAVKTNAVKLAESHIATIAESADQKVEKLVEEKTAEIESKLNEETEKYLKHLGAEWLKENKQSVRQDIRASLFESMFSGIRDLAINHNMTLPEESVDVVAEMEAELTEQQEVSSKLFDENVSLKTKITEMQRSEALATATADLTESQIEQVVSLSEGMQFDESFGKKVSSIVSMVKASSKKEENTISEANININEEATGLNFVAETVPATQEDHMMSAYVRAAKN